MKKYLITIGIIFIFIGATIGFASNIKTKDEANNLFAYVKDNNLILWNENNDKIILSSSFDTSNGPFSDSYFSYSYDKSKIIYLNKVTEKGFELKYADVNNLNNNTLIDTDILSYQIVENGLIYLKATSLYYYDYHTKQELLTDVKDYAVSKTKQELYYLLENGEAYCLELTNLENKTKILSDITGFDTYDDLILAYQKKDNLYSFYIDNQLISDKALSVLDVQNGAFYFIQYEGNLTKVETEADLQELNSNVATYRYQNGSVTKLGDGILSIADGFTNVASDEYLVFGKFNGQTFDISLYNQKEDYTFSLGSTDEYNVYAYDDTTKTIYYQGKDGLFYQANIDNKKLSNEKMIAENVGLIAKRNGHIYYIENTTANLHLLQDQDILIAENINDWFIIDNILYYTKNNEDKTVLACYQCNMPEINNIDSLSNINNQIFYFTDVYTKDNRLYGNLYTIINDVAVLIDNDVTINFGVTTLNQ